MGDVEIKLLGRFAVRQVGEEIGATAFGGRLARTLVRVLAAHRGQVVTRDALIDALWGDQSPADPAANLNALVNRARRALGRPELIETVSGGYVLRAGADVIVDAEVFTTKLQEVRTALAADDAKAAVAAAEEALSLWSGEPLAEDAYAEWARPVRDRLDRAYQEVLELGASAALAMRDARRAAELAGEAAGRQPLREAAHVLLIRGLAADGDSAGALAAYDKLRRTLAQELGIDPSREATQLHERLLRGEPTVSAKDRRPVDDVAFVGRDMELETLAGEDRQGGVALVAGRAGSGKSRLVAELCSRTDRAVISARALLPEREAPWSLARSLLEAAADAGVDAYQLLPERTATAMADLLPGYRGPAHVLDAQTWRALAFRGAAEVLLATENALLVVDDLQWADSSSLDLLALLMSQRGRVGIVLAYRPEEVPTGTPVQRFLSERDVSAAPVAVRLGRLDAAAVGQLVSSPEIAAILAEHTDGTPFAVLQVLHELERTGAVRRHRSRWQPTSPDTAQQTRAAARAGQQRVIWARVQAQPLDRQELVGLLALLGRPASAPLLATATGMALPDILAGLHGLGSADLIRHGLRGFAVAHDLVGETVSSALDPVNGARLHQLLARALVTDEGPVEEQARHFAAAGDLPAASEAYVAAARDRLHQFADREAERLAGEGLELAPARESRSALLEVRAETRARRGDFGDAREDLRTALSLATPGTTRSRLLARLATLTSGTDDLLKAANLAELALAEAGDDPAARGRALYVAALTDMNLERPERAQARFQEALSLFTQVGNAAGVADILDAQAMAQFMDGDIDGAIEAFDRVAGLFADAGNLLRVITPRSTRGHGLAFAGEPDRGLADVDSALELARSLGYAEGEAFAGWQRAEVLTHCGRTDEALKQGSEAVAIARRVGHRGWTATALLAHGIALKAAGDFAGATQAFQDSLDLSGHFSSFASWAHARLALVCIPEGRLSEAAWHVDRALSTGSPFVHYEGRLAQCELAVARGDADAAQLIADAVSRAEAGGHRLSLERLVELRDAL